MAGLAAPSLHALRGREDLRGAVVERRAGEPRAHKAPQPSTQTFVEEVARTFYGSQELPPAVLAALTDSRSGPTWDRYVSVIRPWFAHAAASVPPLAALPADPLRFAEWLVTAGHADRGYSQTKARCVAITALSALVGAPSPMDHAIPGAIRNLAAQSCPSQCAQSDTGAARLPPCSNASFHAPRRPRQPQQRAPWAL